MKLDDAQALAELLMEKHGLDKQGWSFKFTNHTKRNGACDYAAREILLSWRWVLINNEAVVQNTILHEVAHALTPGAGHGFQWVLRAREIGCDGRIKSRGTVQPPGKYQLVCDSCGKVREMYKKPKVERSCGKCDPGAYNEIFKLRLVVKR